MLLFLLSLQQRGQSVNGDGGVIPIGFEDHLISLFNTMREDGED